MDKNEKELVGGLFTVLHHTREAQLEAEKKAGPPGIPTNVSIDYGSSYGGHHGRFECTARVDFVVPVGKIDEFYKWAEKALGLKRGRL